MRILMQNRNELHGNKVRLVKTLMKRESLEEYPELMKWKLQMLYLYNNDWVEVCRIDNYPHENKVQSHIHTYRMKEVKWVGVTFEEADIAIREIGPRIINQEFKENISL